MYFSRETIVSLMLAVASPAAASIWPIPRSITTGNTTLLITQKIAVTYNSVPVRWKSCPPESHGSYESYEFSESLGPESSGSSGPEPSESESQWSSRSCPVADHQHRSSPNRVSPPNQIVYTHGYEPYDVTNSHQLVQAGVSRTLSSIFQTGLVPWKLHPKNSLDKYEPNLWAAGSYVSKLVITQSGNDSNAVKPDTLDESYNLTLSAAGIATLSAPTYVGVLRGLESFSQLFYKHTSGNSYYTPYAPVSIQDTPKYEHRGVLLDVARNWFEVSHIYRTLDAISWNKMNRLHLHITDSQSWPLEIPSMPEIAAKGAYRSDLTYSAADLEKLQKYAVARGIELIVEIDMPGHIGSLALSHPELIVAYDAFPYFWWCAEPPCGAFKLNDTAVDAFLDKLFDDLMPRIAPYASYFHTGGDELNANDSRLDPGVGTDSKAVLQPLLQKFVDANHARVRKHGLSPMVWEEIPLDWSVKLGKDTVVQTWLGTESVKNITGQGHKVIDSNYNFWYLDCGRGQWLNFDSGAAVSGFYPFGDWCAPYKNWRLVYSHDPADGLTEEEAKFVLGGEVAIWSEMADGTNLDTLLWPRGSAAAEVLWSGNVDASGQNRSQLTVSPRLNEFRERMVGRGVMAAPVQMVWCSQTDSTDCSYPVGPGY
ncbi:glycoside hydrolase family 20 protein [Ophiostoma piceae UAMH 11346]|uniref:Beta-hexosaminidase n=1 Tax=Ophiostoma piceae (strain UAMH 11346) TaxID=1262450 RepID=S3D3D3_OPHP1|nr:glycoside hydrolase family 20 protein [Ophiostoma piceae UAMH 11346]